LPPVVAGGEDEVVGAAMVGAEDDEGDDNGDDDDGIPEAVVLLVVAAAFCVKSIVRRTGWHISSAAAAPTTISDVAHNSKLLTLAGIVTLIGSMIGGASFPPPRTRLTSMPIFLVERLLSVAVDVVVAVVSVLGGVAVFGVIPPPLSPIFNVNVSGLVPSGGGLVVVVVVVPVLSSRPPVNV
jgi:hypothetical protein